MGTSHSVSSAPGNDPLVTIAIPTFNGASWLKGCLFSALAQTYQHFEILVSDNASTDHTQELLKEFRDPRVRVVSQKRNIGLLPNWNACVAAAKGDYMVLVPVDDRIEPWLLERCISLVRTEPQIPIVIGLSDLHSIALARTWPANVNRKFGTGIWDGPDILQEFLNGHISAQMSGIMIQLKALRARGGFPIEFPYSGDKAGWAPLLLRGRAGFVNESCATFYIHKASQSGKSAVDICVNDERKFADLIINMNTADCSIEEPRKRRKVNSAASGYSARRAIQLLATHRQSGASLVEVLPMLWQSRRHLSRMGIVNVLRLGRPLAILFLPEPIADWVVRLLGPIYRYAVSWRL